MDTNALGTIGGGLAVVSTLVLTVWNGFLRQKVKMAETRTAEATASQTQAQAVAGETVYNLVTEQLKRVQEELTQVRNEQSQMREQLREKDNEIHVLRMHIVDLEHALVQHGITPPTMRTL